ncbi:glycosyltransferase family 2 protein [Microbulbifer aggregans]|uniref:glycosyltransferase family 2 protein n=1 Tax=Microbulbifer aggregans TaxID=1769779 RepID=UPI001CFF5271|nr:glycosyltransferase family 2 protein [Microbulbifer aggregans]
MNNPNTVDLAVIIVNYKTPKLVIDCLDSLYPELSNIKSRVIVVDNASGDNSLSQIEKWLKSKRNEERHLTHLVQSEKNGGFSAGNNLGIRQVKAKKYLLLNSDTIVRSKAIEKLLRRMDENPEIGALGPRLEYLDETPQISAFRKRTVTSEFIRGAELSVVTRFLKHKKVSIDLDQVNQVIDWVSFACVLIRHEVIEKVGLMDDRFFMYFEDIEYCNRIKGAGYKIEQEPLARVVHLRGGTSTVKSSLAKRKRLPRYFYESRARYFTLLGGRSTLMAANFAWMFGRIFRLIKLTRGLRGLQSVKSEWKDIWIGINSQ